MADKKLSETENLSYDLSTPVFVAVVKYSSNEPSAIVENRKIPLSDFAKASDLSNYATNTALTNAVNTLDAKFNNYPLDTAVVHNTGNETVAGNKSFTGTITATTQETSDNSSKVATTAFVKNITASTFPAGAIAPFGGSTVPTGWLACNGATVSRTRYSGLFAAIGTTWGSGDGSTTFNLPNLTNGYIPLNKSSFINSYSEIYNASPNVNDVIELTDNNEDRIWVVSFFISELHQYGNAYIQGVLNNNIIYRWKIETWSTGGGQTRWNGATTFIARNGDKFKITAVESVRNLIVRRVAYFDMTKSTQSKYCIKF